jgi:nitroimidazol reductase NimA-like FMN-containing flavoprotein (pyridoxamine 5'-phosphate oxidase superfamily)
MRESEITEILDRPISRELLVRDVLRLAYVAKDGTPRNVPIAFTWNGSEIVMCTTKNAPKLRALRHNPAVALTIETWAKLIDFETTLPSAVEELVRQRDERQRA